MSNIIDLIADDLQLPKTLVKSAVDFARSNNRKIIFPKKTGGKRTALQPSVESKPIMHWLRLKLIELLPIHMIATGFRANHSILTNADRHRQSAYSVRIDIENFFESISFNDFKKTLESNKATLPSWALEEATLSLVEKICFDRDGRLPIGYPTSPGIANATMFEIDSALESLILDTTTFGQAIVSRYADDFTFSTDLRGSCRAFLEKLELLLASQTSPTLRINAKKTRFMSRGGGSTLVTGLRINNCGVVVVHPEYRDHIRLLLKLYSRNTLKQEDIPRLLGHLAHIQNVDPGFFTKLSYRYHEEISRIRKK
ncbi:MULTISPECIES: reverse transcriptase domain-containing protein [Achromobacter]|uniref:RNA-directed DNA polymerase n=1 Tax=Achromobacter denitrificans TaxID=32002 RepID=A0A6N0JUT3_ACHDE|nr:MULTISPECIES: reverse transcriptase domain-containing protein [Achromobacter]QKQ51002.1 RNA-directed DNA polymerase [Achromobacter denitrificans]CAB3867582.1 hypothetical protein LMG1860_03661 [Achromobacter denitrificans]